MQYTVVHSKDPYLLARLATDLQMSGLDKRYENLGDDDFQHPFYRYMEWCEIISSDFNFHNHPCSSIPIRHELTSRNYIKVLTQILEP